MNEIYKNELTIFLNYFIPSVKLLKNKEEIYTEYMIMTLANYDIMKYEQIRNNCDVIDYVLLNVFKQYDEFLESEYVKRTK